ncbi:MAG TPA: exodeoxyribonuclease V subunit gamma, partial [Propionibacteriaceae bacterium]
MTFYLHRAERADRLALELAGLLARPLDDAFTSELVAVPTQGVERWLAQTLSHRLGTSDGGRDGVCAGVEFPSLRQLTSTVLGSATGFDLATDPWQPRRLVWPLLKVVDEAHGEPWAQLLWSYLGDQPDIASSCPPSGGADDPVRRGRRWFTARHLADLFLQYAGSRPQMIRSWRDGHDVDGSGRPLPSDYSWQAELWRRLRAEVEVPSPAERLSLGCARLTEEPGLAELPARVSVFGATRLAPQHREVLAALSVHRDVHLWLPHPSPVLWQRMSTVPRAVLMPGPRRSDRTAELPANPLLTYLGRDTRELQVNLTQLAEGVDLHHRASTDSALPRTLLQLLQRDLAQDRPVAAEAERPELDTGDRSVSVHASHGHDRQVEVLRDVLVGLLADDPTLEPRDIVVMCPDIERFAPLISASFGLSSDESAVEHPGHRLRVRLADRALRQVNPLLGALSRVLGLADTRLTAATLLDLCSYPPVAHKFAFSEDELDRLRDLVARAGVR